LDHEGLAIDSVSDLMVSVGDADCVVIVTNHTSYDYLAILGAAKLVVDTRNALGEAGRDHPNVFRL
jgi:UDP-N-acetyl-D-glucosamine dehydrogenase